MTEEVDGNLKEVTTDNGTILIDKKIRVVPNLRSGGWLADGHDGNFMFTGCKFEIDLPLDAKRNQLKQILTKEEAAFFEKELFLEHGALSIYKKEDNYWHSFRVKLGKDEITLDLSDPIDNLKWRVLKASPFVANSWNERHQSGEFQFVLVDQDVQTKQNVKKANNRKDAYKFLGKIEGNKVRMREVLRVYGNTPAPDATADFMYAKLDEIIDDPSTIGRLLAVIGDPHFEMKIFIEDALEAGAIEKDGTRYNLPGGDKIGGTLDETITYFKSKKNQDIYLQVKTQTELND